MENPLRTGLNLVSQAMLTPDSVFVTSASHACGMRKLAKQGSLLPTVDKACSST